MTDPDRSTPQPDARQPDATAAVPPIPPPPAASPAAPPAYDSAPYVAPAAPAYDTAPYPPSAPAYAPPTYPGSPYGAPTSYDAPPAAGAYGAAYPVQPAPGAPPVAPAYGYGGYGYARKTNGLAVASMVLSIVGFIWILPFIGSLAGAIMGHVALGQIKRTGDGGRGMALAGVIVGWAGVAFIAVMVVFFVLAFAAAGSSYSYS